MKKYKFGIIGAGLIADFHARAIRELPNARLVGVHSRTFEKAKRLAAAYGAKAYETLAGLLKDVDVVTIATASGVHLEPAVAAAQAGVHVICEKPLEITLERIDAMIAAHRKAGTLLGGVFQNRFNDAMGPLRQAIGDQRFGAITYAGLFVPWWREDGYYKDSWHGTWALDGGGAMMNQSIHMVDMLIDLMGLPEVVTGFTATLGHAIEAEDTAVGCMRFPNGALGVMYGTTASWPGQFKRFELTGTRGTAVYVENGFTVWRFADEGPADEEVRQRFGVIEGGGGVADPAAITHENHRRNFAAFLAALEAGSAFEIDAAEARKSVALILALYESARTGRVVHPDGQEA